MTTGVMVTVDAGTPSGSSLPKVVHSNYYDIDDSGENNVRAIFSGHDHYNTNTVYVGVTNQEQDVAFTNGNNFVLSA